MKRMRLFRGRSGPALLLVSLAASSASAATLPDSQRLDPVRAALEKTVDQATRDGLPADLIVGKVREGLAKGVAAEAIRVAAERLAQNLGEASRFLKAHRKATAPTPLIRAVAEARGASINLEIVKPMVESSAADAPLTRAVEAVTDMSMRGYPSQRAASVVKEVLEREPAAVTQVVAGVESIRLGQTLSRADALESLGRNIFSGGATLETAVTRALESGERAGSATPSSAKGRSAEHRNDAGNKKPLGVGGHPGMGPKK